MSEWNVRRVLHALVRSWWLLVGVALVAGVIAYVVAGRAETAWVGNAMLRIDNATVSANPTVLPLPERLLGELQSAEFKQRVFDEAGTSEGELSFYTIGNPQTELHVLYVGPSEEMAERVIDVAARAVIDQRIKMSETEIGFIRQRIAEERAIVEAIEDLLGDPELTSVQEAEYRYRVYTVRVPLIADEALLQRLENAYSYADDASVAIQDLRGSQRSSGLAAAFIGFVFAALIVMLREYRKYLSTRGGKAPVAC